MFVNKIKLHLIWLLLLAFVVPSISAANGNGVRRYLSLGTSLSVGVQPGPDGVNIRTDDSYPDQLLEISEFDSTADDQRSALMQPSWFDIQYATTSINCVSTSLFGQECYRIRFVE